jgi:DNA-binding CsgD family transcriptional regulator
VIVWFNEITPVRAAVITVLFYGYLTTVVWYGLLRSRKEKKRSKQTAYPQNMRLFLQLVCIFYPLTAVFTIPSVLMLSPTLFSSLPRSLLAFCWGAMEMFVFISGERRSVSASVHRNAVEIYSLTPREQDVASLAIAGLTCKQISEKLFISEKTVETHLYNIYRKCDVKNRLELQRVLHGSS